MTTHTERRTPRTQAETSVKPADFFYKDGRFATAKRSLWNEPVLFMRMAKIVDPGHRQLNLESTDGRHFRVIHMQTEKGLYSQNISSTCSYTRFCRPRERLLYRQRADPAARVRVLREYTI